MAVEIDSIPNSKAIGWADARLARDAANTLAQRNGANAQTFNIYNTYTSGSNYERGFMRWSSNVLQIGCEAAGTGSGRVTEIRSAAQLDFYCFGSRWVRISSNTFVFYGSSFFFTALPTSNPGVAGQIWNDSGTLKISAG